MIPALFALVLIGTIAGRTPVAVFTVGANPEARAVGTGALVDGWLVECIEQKRVTLRQGGQRQVLGIGDATGVVGVLPRVLPPDATPRVTITRDLRARLDGVFLIQTVMSACSEAVRGGYRLSEIDEGSLFQTVGFQDGDVVTDIDGRPLDSPLNAMSALTSAKGKSQFTIGYARRGVAKTLEVMVQ